MASPMGAGRSSASSGPFSRMAGRSVMPWGGSGIALPARQRIKRNESGHAACKVHSTGSTSATSACPPPCSPAMISTSGRAWRIAGHLPYPDHRETAQNARDDEQQARLEGRGDRIGQIDHGGGCKPAHPQRAEEFCPQMRDQRNDHRIDWPDAEGDEERCNDGDRGAEPGDALQERGKHPAQRDDDEQFVAAEPGDALPQRVIAAGLVGDLIEQQRRPDHIEDENCVPDALGAGDGDGREGRRKGEKRNDRGGEHAHRPGLRCRPAQDDQKHQQHDDGQQGENQERNRPSTEIRPCCVLVPRQHGCPISKPMVPGKWEDATG